MIFFVLESRSDSEKNVVEKTKIGVRSNRLVLIGKILVADEQSELHVSCPFDQLGLL